jgi:hypothetical protein
MKHVYAYAIGFVLLLPFSVSATATLVSDGGTGTSTAPAFGQLLIGNGSGEYDFISTSSLNISWGNILGDWASQTDLYSTMFSTFVSYGQSSSDIDLPDPYRLTTAKLYLRSLTGPTAYFNTQDLSENREYILPDSNGHLITSSFLEAAYVPYAGANQTVDLGEQSLVTTGTTTVGTLVIPLASSFLAVDANGVVIATTTPAGGTQNTANAVYADGTAYTLTATPAKIDFGTTDPSITLTEAGTYLIYSRARIDYSAATLLGTQTVTTKLRRTNNTAADLTNSPAGFKTAIVTLFTGTAGILTGPMITYTTSNTNDVIELWGSISSTPTVGNITVPEADIMVVKLY